jgi:amidophosphoribosyltransferase
MPAADELIAHGRTTEEVAKLIEVDKLIYQELDDLIEASKEGNPHVDGFECSVFTGDYVTGDVDDAYLARISDQRNDKAKLRHESSGEASVIGLHNSRKVN